MKIIESLQQNTPEWLEFRKNKIGASDAPIIMGVSPWATKLQLWERKVGISPEQPENFAMTRGKSLEHEARWVFEEGTGSEFPSCVVQHEKYEWMIASLDGLSNCKKHALEIKCPGREDHLSALQGGVPKKYYPQLQHQLAITGLGMIYYYSYDGKNNACIEVMRNQEYINNLIEEELKFYKCIKTCTPPEISESDYNIRYDKEWDYATRYWLRSQANLKDAEYHEKKARQELIEASQSRNSKGFGVRVQKITRSGSIDYSQIKEIQGKNLDQYRKPGTESWRITIDE